jgi:predicted nucleic acid-binding protein
MSTTNAFLDSNVWLYAFIKGQDSNKTAKAIILINALSTIFVSTQVINEVCVNLLRKQRASETEIRDVIDDFFTLYNVIELDQEQLIHASNLRERYSLSYWDSLIIAAALASKTSIIYSEDMQDGLLVENQVTLVNPFK